MTTVRPSDVGDYLATVRGLLIGIISAVTAAAAATAAVFLAAAQVASFGGAISAVVAAASGIATFATTGLAVARGLHKLIKRE
jgi:hypothetical protein